MSFDLLPTAPALDSTTSALPAGATLTLSPAAGDDSARAETDCAAGPQPLRASALHGEAPPVLTLTF